MVSQVQSQRLKKFNVVQGKALCMHVVQSLCVCHPSRRSQPRLVFCLPLDTCLVELQSEQKVGRWAANPERSHGGRSNRIGASFILNDDLVAYAQRKKEEELREAKQNKKYPFNKQSGPS